MAALHPNGFKLLLRSRNPVASFLSVSGHQQALHGCKVQSSAQHPAGLSLDTTGHSELTTHSHGPSTSASASRALHDHLSSSSPSASPPPRSFSTSSPSPATQSTVHTMQAQQPKPGLAAAALIVPLVGAAGMSGATCMVLDPSTAACCTAVLQCLTCTASAIYALQLVAGGTATVAPPLPGLPASWQAALSTDSTSSSPSSAAHGAAAVVLQTIRLPLLQACSIVLTGPYILALVWAAACHPSVPQLNYVPLTLAAAASALVMLFSETTRKSYSDKRRVVMQIDAGEGEAFPVMTQGARLATRNYLAAYLVVAALVDCVCSCLAGSVVLAIGSGSAGMALAWVAYQRCVVGGSSGL